MTERNGRCLCGAVSFTLSKDPVVTRICWCKDCQHLSANGAVNLLVTTDSLSFTGEIAEFTKQADSGNQITRQFCPTCGVQLFAKVDVRPQFRIVRAGNLDETSSIKPDMNIWTTSAPDWACLDMTLEQAERQAPPPKPAAV